DVMHAEEQYVLGVLGGAEAQERAAQQRAPLEVERPVRLVRGDAPRPPSRLRRAETGEIDQRQRERRRRRDDLDRPAVALGEGGAQRLMAPYDLGEDGGEQGRRQDAPGGERKRHVVDAAAREHPVEEPEPFL